MKTLTLSYTNPAKIKIAYTAILLFIFFNISNAQITLTAPSQNATLTQGNPITISANVMVGNVSNVTFWVDNDEGDWKWIGSTNTPPYQVINHIVKPGTNKIRARVTYGGGTANTAIDVSTNDNGGGSSGEIEITTSQGTALTVGSPITIIATANNGSTVTFWVDNDEGDWKWIGSANIRPYQVVNHIVKPGTDKIRARVVYNGTTTNAEITVTTNNNGGNSGGCNTTASFPQNFALGIDGGQPVHDVNGSNLMDDIEFSGKTRYKLIEESGAKFVRINFFRPSNFKQNQYDWLSDYEEIIDHFHPGIPIYAVVTDVVGNDIPGHSNGGTDDYPTNESWKQSPWIDAYVDAFDKIVQRFCGKIAVYESFNEPNVWRHGQQQPKMAQAQFAELLNKTYERLKPNGTNPYKITLVSGPLEAHDLYPKEPNATTYYGGAADYFEQVRTIGENSFSWGVNGYYPFDAIGYHIYVNQHVNGQENNQIENSINQSLTAIWNVTSNLPTNKWKLYISEIGWNSELMSDRLNDNVTTNEEAQANFMMRAIKHIANNHSGGVKAVSFFSLMSFNNDEGPGLEDFGIARPQYYDNTGKKEPCFCTFQKLAINPWNHWPVIVDCNVSNY